jgi:hypothetical protein
VPQVLQLPAYPALVALLQPHTRKQVAQKLATALLDTGGRLSDVAAVEALFDFIRPLVDSGEGEGEGGEAMDDEVRRRPLRAGPGGGGGLHCLRATHPAVAPGSRHHAPRHTTPHDTARYRTIPHNTTPTQQQHNTNTTQHQHNTTQHNTTQHNTTQHNTAHTAQHNTLHPAAGL